MNKIKVLMVCPKMISDGGIQKYIYDLSMYYDKEKFKFEYLVLDDNTLGQENYLSKLSKKGDKIFLVPAFQKEPLKSLVEITQILYNRKNYILHIHITGGFSSIIGFLAKIMGFKHIIYHSHNVQSRKKLKDSFLKLLFVSSGTFYMACTHEAGRYRFGQNITNSNKFFIARNGIKANRFKFDKKLRNRIRSQYNVKENQCVLGFVGRLSSEKNIEFLLNIMEKLKKDNNYVLFIIGNGPEKEKLKAISNKLDLEDEVLFLGSRTNIEEFLSAFDIFLLPSLNEAFGIVLLEAQASGLPCIVSNNITSEPKLSKDFIHLDLDINLWIDVIKSLPTNTDRNKSYQVIVDNFYDLKDTSYDVYKVYESLEKYEDRGL